MKRICFSVLTALAIILSFSVAAQDVEYSGYIVSLSDNSPELFSASLMSDGETDTEDLTPEQTAKLLSENIDNVSEIYAPKKLVKVEDEATLKMLIDSGAVEYFEPDYKAELYGYNPSANPFYASQWGLTAIKADGAWNCGVFGNNVRVAVIDSGIYPNNDLKNNLAKGWNYTVSSTIDDRSDTTDNLWHGTCVAGIIASECNNITTVGLAHRATLVPIKITEGTSLFSSDIISGINGAVNDYHCDVLNLSVGTSGDSIGLKKAIDDAIEKGCIVVAAAGNNSSSAYSYPASYDSCISVANAMISDNGTDSMYKIYPTSQHNNMVDIAAPGTSIKSTARNESGYTAGTGTSFSAPFVSAAAALAKSIDPNINQAAFNYFLRISANSSYKTATQDSTYWGAGMLDVEKLIKLLLSKKKVYASVIDVQSFGNNTSMYIYNPSSSEKTYTAVLTSSSIIGDIKRLNDIKIIPVTLAAGQTEEISFTALGISGNVSASLFDDIGKLVPLIDKRSAISNY